MGSEAGAANQCCLLVAGRPKPSTYVEPGTPRAQRRARSRARRASAAAELGQPTAVDVHVGLLPIVVRLVAQACDALVVVGAGEALVVADDVADRDPEPAAQPTRQRQRRTQLGGPVEDLPVRETRVLDPDRGVVQT